MKTTKITVENFFEAMYAKKGWEELVTEEVLFEGPFTPLMKGKESFMQITNQFLGNMYKAKVRNMIVQDDTACVLASYQLGHPDMAILDLDACEIIKVKDGKVDSMEIYFDSQKLASFMSKMQK
ncbi:MAG: nuclear transport factor 2 family protein [Flavobacteriaceae bacterium]|nr:nuclear transport factor 2 family protein [Flavobacteriaceae bacterium]